MAANEEENVVLLPETAVKTATAINASLKEAELNLKIAQDELEEVKKSFGVSGGFAKEKIKTIYEGETSDEKESAVSGKVTITPQLELEGQYSKDQKTATLNYTPFTLAKKIDIKNKEQNVVTKQLAYISARLKVITDVRNAYADLFQKEKLLQLTYENLQLAKDHLKITHNFFNLGKVLELDMMEAEQAVKVAEVKVTSAELYRMAARDKLADLLGMNNVDGITVDGDALPKNSFAQVDLDNTIARCIKESPEIQEQAIAQELANLNLILVKWSWAKDLQIYASRDKSKESYAGIITYDEVTYSLGVNVPLYQSTWTNEVKLAMKNVAVVKAQQEQMLQRIKNQLQDAYREWKLLELSLTPLEQTIVIDRERLRIMNSKFENGVVSGTEVNRARQDLADAEQDYWQAWLNRQQAREAFEQAALGYVVVVK
jgi:outer membrane protein TolC